MKIIWTYLQLYITSKILHTSKYALLKLSKTKSPELLFPFDCITLYNGMNDMSGTRHTSMNGMSSKLVKRYERNARYSAYRYERYERLKTVNR